ncbi:MAG TPA: DUF3883 domain-containing protein [Thermoplasmata archaeon]|nr:DUF3883 domain-containing protein [Thermoplasmata archaeon]
MNRTGRHELAERTFISRYVRDGQRLVRASTTAPFDLALFRVADGSLRTTFIEIKTSQGRRTSDLSDLEADFARFAEMHGSPYVVARYQVTGERVVSEHLYRPFSIPEVPDAEVILEVTASP